MCKKSKLGSGRISGLLQMNYIFAEHGILRAIFSHKESFGNECGFKVFSDMGSYSN